MENLSYKGTVIHVGNVNNVTDKFSKREVIICDNSSKYPTQIPFELQNDNTDLGNNLQPGDEVEINFNLKGLKDAWTDKNGFKKWFSTLVIWKLTKTKEAFIPQQPTAQEPKKAEPKKYIAPAIVDEDPTDLPF